MYEEKTEAIEITLKDNNGLKTFPDATQTHLQCMSLTLHANALLKV